MQKNFKVFLSVVLVLLCGALAFGQDKVAYKDVVLDGKPAKLNMATGEIILVNPKDKKERVSLDNKTTLPEKSSQTIEKPESDYYTVKQGETLFEIATRFNTSLTELKRLNNLETTLIDKGQILKVKSTEDVESTGFKSNEEPLLKDTNKAIHIVEKGQTLYSLSKQYGLTVSQLKQQNGLSSNLIKIGQKLNVDNSNSSKELGNLSVWIVSKGDTLYAIAKQNDTTVQNLKDLNGLTSNLIKVGQKLRLK